MRKPRLLELNPGTLWFTEMGEADESVHIDRQDASGSSDDGKMDWKIIFGTEKTLTRKEIVERLKGVGTSERTADRLIKAAKDDQPGRLILDKHGVYSLPPEEGSETLPLPTAA